MKFLLDIAIFNISPTISFKSCPINAKVMFSASSISKLLFPSTLLFLEKWRKKWNGMEGNSNAA